MDGSRSEHSRLPPDTAGLLALWSHMVTSVERQVFTSSTTGERIYGPPIDVEDWELVSVELWVDSNSDVGSAFVWNVETCIDLVRPDWDDMEAFSQSVGDAGQGTAIDAGGPTSQVKVRKWLRWRVERNAGFAATLVFTVRVGFKRRVAIPAPFEVWSLASEVRTDLLALRAPASAADLLLRSLLQARFPAAEGNAQSAVDPGGDDGFDWQPRISPQALRQTFDMLAGYGIHFRPAGEGVSVEVAMPTVPLPDYFGVRREDLEARLRQRAG